MAVSDLSPQERLVWDTLHSQQPQLTKKQVAERLELPVGQVNSVYDKCREKLGLKFSSEVNANALEKRDPETAADALIELSARDRTLVDIAEELGLNDSLVLALEKRLTHGMVPLARGLGEVKKSELRDLYADVNWKVLAAITDADIEKAPLRDKLVAAGISTDKLLQLDGQPTQVFSIPQLDNLDKLSEMLLREVDRRRLTIDLDPQTVTVEIEPQAEPR